MIKENANANVFTDNSSDDNIAKKDNFPETEKPYFLECLRSGDKSGWLIKNG